jgi:hypothetical protein
MFAARPRLLISISTNAEGGKSIVLYSNHQPRIPPMDTIFLNSFVKIRVIRGKEAMHVPRVLAKHYFAGLKPLLSSWKSFGLADKPSRLQPTSMR